MSDKPRQRVSAELLAATPEQIDQQRRVITQTRSTVAAYLAAIDQLRPERATYDTLGLGDDLILSDEAFQGTGTTKEDYRAAINSIDKLLTAADTPDGGNLEKFAR
ncbi:MAG TPA: hypothetical protein VNM70_19470 [Burkholderiales bacterium]|nr:hypothetical protein [Burkholderiales bacterium]